MFNLHKSKIYLVVFIVTASILAWGVWNNYRPQMVYASCADIAEKTSNLRSRKDFLKTDTSKDFEEVFNECLSDAGYFEVK